MTARTPASVRAVFRAAAGTFYFYQKVEAQRLAAVKVRGIPCRAL
jgi:hypothetical protein